MGKNISVSLVTPTMHTSNLSIAHSANVSSTNLSSYLSSEQTNCSSSWKNTDVSLSNLEGNYDMFNAFIGCNIGCREVLAAPLVLNLPNRKSCLATKDVETKAALEMRNNFEP